MGFFKRIAGFLGFSKDESHEDEEDGDDSDNISNQTRTTHSTKFEPTGLPRKGFAVPVKVSVERPPQPGPLLVPCSSAHGSVQGLNWYIKCLKMDEDGDVASEFLDEVPKIASSTVNQHISPPRFQVKNNTRPAKIKNLVLSPDGNILQSVEY